MIDMTSPIKKWAEERLLAVETLPAGAWQRTSTLYDDFARWTHQARGGMMEQREFSRHLGNLEGLRIVRRAAGYTVLYVTLPEFLTHYPDWPRKPFVAKVRMTAPVMTKRELKHGFQAKPLSVAMTALSMIGGIEPEASDGLHRAQVIASEALRALTGSARK